MLVKTEAITHETRTHIRSALDRIFTHKEEGDLDSVVSEVLNDRDVFLYLMTHLKKFQGVELGRMSYWDDARVEVPYGLTINYVGEPPRTVLFAYTLVNGRHAEELRFYDIMPKHLVEGRGEDVCGIPKPENFAGVVNVVLQNIEKESIIDLSGMIKKHGSG